MLVVEAVFSLSLNENLNTPLNQKALSMKLSWTTKHKAKAKYGFWSAHAEQNDIRFLRHFGKGRQHPRDERTFHI